MRRALIIGALLVVTAGCTHQRVYPAHSQYDVIVWCDAHLDRFKEWTPAQLEMCGRAYEQIRPVPQRQQVSSPPPPSYRGLSGTICMRFGRDMFYCD